MLITFKGNDDLSHTYIVCRFDECLLIDPSHDLELIQEKLTDKTLKGIILTHAHADHVHLIHYFDVPIYLHTLDHELLFDDRYNGYDKVNKRPYKSKDLDLIKINDGDKIKLGDKQVSIIHTPGHTQGGVSYYFDGMLFTGDTLFQNDAGRHDLYSGDLFSLKKSIKKIIDDYPSDTKIYPGHDGFTTVRQERKSNPYYLKWTKQQKK